VNGLRSWGRIEAPHAAYYGQVDGAQVASWGTKYRSRLFAKNLRGVLGDTEVNDEIRGTIEKNPEMFFYDNNGITLTAKKLAKTMFGGADTTHGTFHCTDVSIVKGAQTAGSIGKYATVSLEKAAKVFVTSHYLTRTRRSELWGERHKNEQSPKSNRKWRFCLTRETLIK